MILLTALKCLPVPSGPVCDITILLPLLGVNSVNAGLDHKDSLGLTLCIEIINQISH